MEKGKHKLSKKVDDPINQRLNKGWLDSKTMQHEVTLEPNFPTV
jgi:hypothetical protein